MGDDVVCEVCVDVVLSEMDISVWDEVEVQSEAILNTIETIVFMR
jgi:hypothetical protein